MRRILLAAAIVAAAFSGSTGSVGQAQAPSLLYVCVQDDAKVAVVDTIRAAVVRTVDLQKLGFPATAKPHYIVVEPDGSHWYVSLIGANKVVKFDRNDRVVGHYEMETPGMLSLTGDGKLVVSRSMSAVNPPKRIAVIDRAKMTGEEIDILFPRPHPMAVVRGFAYTASLGVNQLASIDLASQKVEIVNVDGPPHGFVQFAVSPDRAVLAVSTEVSGRLMAFDLQQPARPRLITNVELGKMAFDPVFTADGGEIWVPVKMSNEIAIVSTNSGKVEARISDPAFKQPHQIVFSADRKTAFVTNNNKMDHMADPAHAGHAMPGAGDGTASLVVIDVATRKVTKSIPLGKNLTGMGSWAR